MSNLNKETISNTLIPFRIKDKWGFSDSSKDIIIPCTFEDCDKFINGIAIVKRDGKFGAIDINGKFIIQNQFDKISRFHKNNISIVGLNGKLGCIDTNGNIVIPIDYEYLQNTGGEYIDFSEKNKTGILDLTGKKIINAEYSSIQLSCKYDSTPYFVVSYMKEKKMVRCLIDSGNNIISDYYDDIQLARSIDGNINYNKEGLYTVRKDGKYGVINYTGQLIIPLIYDLINDFNAINNIAKINDKFGLLNVNNQIIIPFEYDNISVINKTSLLFIKKDKKVGIIDNKGDFILPIKYDEGKWKDSVKYSDDFIRIEENGKFGYINLEGKVVISLEYDSISLFQNGFADVLKDNKHGVIDNKGIMIVPIEYDEIKISKKLFIVKKNNLKGIINSNGEILVLPIYEEIEFFGNSLFIVQDNKKKRGLINSVSAELLKCKYSKIGDPNNNFRGTNFDLITNGKKQGIINLDGDIVIDCNYKSIWFEGDNLFSITSEDGKKGFVDINNVEYWEN